MSEILEFLKQKEFLAPWLQAILSALAILIAYELGLRQARNQHISAMKVAKEEHRLTAIVLLQTVLAITEQAEGFFSDALDEEGWTLIARLSRYDSAAIEDVVSSINAIPLHELPLPVVATELLRLRRALRVLDVIGKSIGDPGQSLMNGDTLDLSQVLAPLKAGQNAIYSIRSAVEYFVNDNDLHKRDV